MSAPVFIHNHKAALLLRNIRDLRCLTPRRTRGRHPAQVPRHQHGPRQYFDAAYGLQLGPLWPSVRCSLLSERKYGALLNVFADREAVESDLRDQGCSDFVSAARLEGKRKSHGSDQDNTPLRLSSNIKCLVFPRGDITRFKSARPDQLSLLNYYLLDAASVLPCLALDVQEGHRVLDLLLVPYSEGFLRVNDSSVSRTMRLKSVLHSYVPKELLSTDHLWVTSTDGTRWSEDESDTYDRVLVDVPCTTDRHSATEEDFNNIFRKSRTMERKRLPKLQLDLLLAGVRAARPGGEVVYSTCALSQLQNQCVVQQAIHLAHQEGIQLQVVSLQPLVHTFSGTFNFAPDLLLGEMVVPHLSANFGPTYMCKLRRLC
ncbi:hypothetical protein CRUP_021000 [Coryphaenoides rupestris]|nr:hypothetical protein CRUP_021000 [Coryphaenoides rupestris]